MGGAPCGAAGGEGRARPARPPPGSHDGDEHGYGMAIFSTGAMMGPIIDPTLGGWLTENLDWRWCFYIILPVGALVALGVLVFIRQSRPMRSELFDMFGFVMLSVAVGSLQ